jgi:hypothetical protein
MDLRMQSNVGLGSTHPAKMEPTFDPRLDVYRITAIYGGARG